jgi:glycosyltransferase involved in cell wall biosynthesis
LSPFNGNPELILAIGKLLHLVRHLLKELLPVKTIPNPIDTHMFAPMESKTHARRILFVAQDVNNPMKGMSYLDEAVKMLKGDEKVEVIALGRDIPYINNEEEMVELYNSVDAFVLPSLSENLPNTIMEAMACGVPCVAFDVGGIPEMIDHKENGFLARFQNVEDLANGIRYVLSPENNERLGKAARAKVIECYSEKIVAQQYIKVYEQI